MIKKKINLFSCIIGLSGIYGFLSLTHYLIKVPGTKFSFNPKVMFGDFIFGIEFLFSISNPVWVGMLILVIWFWIIFRFSTYFLTKASAS